MSVSDLVQRLQSRPATALAALPEPAGLFAPFAPGANTDSSAVRTRKPAQMLALRPVFAPVAPFAPETTGAGSDEGETARAEAGPNRSGVARLHINRCEQCEQCEHTQKSKHPCGFTADGVFAPADSCGANSANKPPGEGHPLGALPAVRTCADCAHLLRRGTCGEPVAAKLQPWGFGFVGRVGLFLRRGINATDADDLAERLHLRDVQADDRVLCLECVHLSGRPGTWRCGNHRRAGVGRELPAAIVMQPQRCPGRSRFRGQGAPYPCPRHGKRP